MLYRLLTRAHDNSLRSLISKRFAYTGYLLPVVLALGLGISVVSIMAL